MQRRITRANPPTPPNHTDSEVARQKEPVVSHKITVVDPGADGAADIVVNTGSLNDDSDDVATISEETGREKQANEYVPKRWSPGELGRVSRPVKLSTALFELTKKFDCLPYPPPGGFWKCFG
jgi:hypothetical protein